MHDEWTCRRTPLDLIDAAYGFSRQGIRTQTVDGFGGERDQASGAQETRSCVNLGRSWSAEHRPF